MTLPKVGDVIVVTRCVYSDCYPFGCKKSCLGMPMRVTYIHDDYAIIAPVNTGNFTCHISPNDEYSMYNVGKCKETECLYYRNHTSSGCAKTNRPSNPCAMKVTS